MGRELLTEEERIERRKISRKRYYAANREKIAERRKAYYAAHPDKAAEQKARQIAWIKADYYSDLETNREKARIYAREWRLKNPDKWAALCKKQKAREATKRMALTPQEKLIEQTKKRETSFKRRYGISISVYDEMLIQQNGKCYLCNRTPDAERYKRLNIDHCHVTGKIRGLLCTPCNHALGVLGDNIVGIQNALNYLKASE